MRKNIIAFLCNILIFSCSFGQVTDGFNYQAVARDGGGSILSNTSINIRFQVRAGAASGSNVYTETHAPATNGFGLFNLVIGKGLLESGDFSSIDWIADEHYLIVELNGVKMDTSKFQAIPYSKVATDMKLADLTDVGGSAMVGQVLQWDGFEWVAMDDQKDDADADPLNEIQSLSKSGNTVSLSAGGGSFVDEVDDADADPTNEIQTISKSGSTVSLSNGGGDFTDEVNDADADPANEIQIISKSGSTVSLSNGGGDFTDEVNDADADPVNEIQSLSISGNDLTLSNSGGTVSLPISNIWSENGSNIYYNGGNVGIGTNNPLFPLHIDLGEDILFGTNATTTGSKLYYDSSKGGLIGGRIGNYNPVDSVDFYSIAWGFEPVAIGDYSAAFNSQSRAQGNLSFVAGFRTESSTYIQSTFGRYNVRANGSVSTWVDTDPVFVVGNGSSRSNTNNALTLTKGGFLGLNEATPSYLVDIENNDLSSRSIFIDHNNTSPSAPTNYGLYIDLDKTSATSTTTVYGGYAVSTNVGGTAYGLYGWANSDATNAGAAYGVRAITDNDGGTGVAYGLYASVFSSTSSGAEYAGYFAGNVFTTGNFLPSDESLKTRIAPSSPVMDKLMQLDIKTYEYKREAYPHMNLPKGIRTGFMAQNVAEVMPELVDKATQPAMTKEEVERGALAGDQVDFQAVDYASMVPYLVKALQEQQAEIEQLKAELDALKNK
ncbi:MAG: tail fiber domain-containing protein [Bacteroidota bacterium]